MRQKTIRAIDAMAEMVITSREGIELTVNSVTAADWADDTCTSAQRDESDYVRAMGADPGEASGPGLTSRYPRY